MKYDIGLPWSIAPLKGKYYGTIIVDRDGQFVMDVWKIPWEAESGYEPSERELAMWNGDFEACDSHFECVASYEIAKTIVEAINASAQE